MRGVGAILGAVAVSAAVGWAAWLVLAEPAPGPRSAQVEPVARDELPTLPPDIDEPEDERRERDRLDPPTDEDTIWPDEDLPPAERVRRIVRFLCQEDTPDWTLREARPVLRAHPDLAVVELARGLRHEHGLDVCALLLAELGPTAADAVPELRRFLSESPERVAQALVALGPRSVDTLIAGSVNSDPSIRHAVLWAVATWNVHRDGRPARLVRAAEDRLDDPDGGVREAALRAVVRLGGSTERVAEAVRRGLDDESATVRLQVFRQLERLETLPRRLVPRLIQLLRDEDGEVARSAAYALAAYGEDARAASPELLALIREAPAGPSDDTTHAWFAALRAVDPAAVRALVSDPREHVRVQAIYVLDFRVEADRPLLLAALRDPAWSVRRQALHTFFRGPGRRIEPLDLPDEILLVAAERVPGGSVAERRYVLRLLAGQPELPEALGALIDSLLDDPDPEVRRLATEALAKLPNPPPRSVEVLVAALSDPAEDVRVEALDSLRELAPDDAEAVRSVRRLLQDESARVRIRAARALIALEPGAADVLPILRKLRVDGRESIREQVVLAAGELGSDEVLELLIDRLRDKSTTVQAAAARSMRGYGPRAEPAVEALVARLELGYMNVWIECIATLEGIGPAAADAIPVLERHTRSEYRDVAAAATRALDAIRSGDARKRSTAGSVSE